MKQKTKMTHSLKCYFVSSRHKCSSQPVLYTTHYKHPDKNGLTRMVEKYFRRYNGLNLGDSLIIANKSMSK